jgi:hypothetical protein
MASEPSAWAQFFSAENLAYLAEALGARRGAVRRAAAAFGAAGAKEAGGRPAAAGGPPPWGRVRELNRGFLAEFRRARAEAAGAGAGAGAGDEPLHLRQFEADSLRPPGAPGLNGAVLWGGTGGAEVFRKGADDAPWRAGPAAPGEGAALAQALAEFWGGRDPSGTFVPGEGGAFDEGGDAGPAGRGGGVAFGWAPGERPPPPRQGPAARAARHRMRSGGAERDASEAFSGTELEERPRSWDLGAKAWGRWPPPAGR